MSKVIVCQPVFAVMSTASTVAMHELIIAVSIPLFMHKAVWANIAIRMRNRAGYATTRQHLTHLFITTFDNEVVVLSYA